MSDREQLVTSTLMELADTLVSHYDLTDYLDGLLRRTTDLLGGAAGGVMLGDGARGSEALRLLACTDEHTRVLEVFQLQRQEGPCVDSYRGGEAVIEHDLRSTSRWATFAPAAVNRGYGAAFAFPLRLRGTVIGALNLFRTEAGTPADDDLRAAQAFADMATIGILQQRAVGEARALTGHLQAALHSRMVIEQAKGILSERLGLNMEQAYQVIRWFSRNHNRRVRDVADEVVNGGLPADALVEPYDPAR